MNGSLSHLTLDDLKLEKNRIGGLASRFVSIIPIDIIITYPIISGVKMEGNFEVRASEGIKHWHITKDAGEVKSEMVGQLGGQCFKNSINFFVPTNEELLLLNIINLLNRPLIAIGRDKEGKKRVIGTELRTAKLKRSNTTTGTAGNNRMGTTFTIEAYSKLPALFIDEENNNIDYSDSSNEILLSPKFFPEAYDGTPNYSPGGSGTGNATYTAWCEGVSGAYYYLVAPKTPRLRFFIQNQGATLEVHRKKSGDPDFEIVLEATPDQGIDGLYEFTDGPENPFTEENANEGNTTYIYKLRIRKRGFVSPFSRNFYVYTLPEQHLLYKTIAEDTETGDVFDDSSPAFVGLGKAWVNWNGHLDLDFTGVDQIVDIENDVLQKTLGSERLDPPRYADGGKRFISFFFCDEASITEINLTGNGIKTTVEELPLDLSKFTALTNVVLDQNRISKIKFGTWVNQANTTFLLRQNRLDASKMNAILTSLDGTIEAGHTGRVFDLSQNPILYDADLDAQKQQMESDYGISILIDFVHIANNINIEN